jgi:hypothetical protein
MSFVRRLLLRQLMSKTSERKLFVRSENVEQYGSDYKAPLKATSNDFIEVGGWLM